MTTTPDELTKLLAALNAPAARYAELDRYYAGRQPLAFLAPEAKKALGNRFGRMVSNIPRLAIGSLSERLRINGFDGDPALWDDWLRCDLDQLSGAAHREALLLGDAYAIVWADRYGAPAVTVESARQVAVTTDPGTRQVTGAVKRWETDRTTELVWYRPDRIDRLRANNRGAATGFTVIDTIANPLGVVPVVRISNHDLILDGAGRSEIADLCPLVDALNKVLADMMVTSEYIGRPRRWATGIELTEEPVRDDAGNPVLDDDGEPVMVEVNPIPEGNRAMISENADAKFGQLPAADLAGYEAAVRVLLGQIMAVTTLPAHYVGVFTDNPASADALRAAEASLTARAEAKQAAFGRAWEHVGRLMVAVRTGRDPMQINNIRVRWTDAATRSVAQEADAVVKLFSAGLLPASYALGRIGYSADEIDKISAARSLDAATNVNVAELFR